MRTREAILVTAFVNNLHAMIHTTTNPDPLRKEIMTAVMDNMIAMLRESGPDAIDSLRATISRISHPVYALTTKTIDVEFIIVWQTTLLDLMEAEAHSTERN